MADGELEARLTAIEIALAHQQKAIDELSEMMVKQGKMLDILTQQYTSFKQFLEEQDIVKPLSEEVPPPHY
jgi:SlyX protein